MVVREKEKKGDDDDEDEYEYQYEYQVGYLLSHKCNTNANTRAC